VSGRTGRFEKRTARTIAVQLCSLYEPLLKEGTLTENVSARGARVATRGEWPPGARLLLIAPEYNVRLEAQIVYCQRLGKNRFAVGLELSARVEQWAEPASRNNGLT
jgi:hypothetical protein